MNDTILIVLAVAVVALMIISSITLVLLMRRQKTGDDGQSMQMLNQNVQGMQERLDKVAGGLNERLDNAARVIGAVGKELGAMQEIGRNMQALQDFLKSPKLRGNIGEQVLKQMLNQYFPTHLFALQYKFNNGQMVDAIIKTDNGIIPIDSKFPMENYQKMVKVETDEQRDAAQRDFIKDVKKHVNDISKKYILPDEGTVDFAVMYVPSEAVYYEIIRSDIDINQHGLDRKVLFASPNSFYYFMRILMMGIQEKQIAEAARDIIGAIRGIQKDAERFGETLGVLNTHISNAKTAFDRTTAEFTKLSGKIENVDQIGETKLLK
ncbi:MAG: DNA recombination protein RmuC [Candidatus Kerfeldbacteria bacterium]